MAQILLLLKGKDIMWNLYGFEISSEKKFKEC
jgi:hypothetical protein